MTSLSQIIFENIDKDDIVLDIGCGIKDKLHFVQCKEKIYLDAWEKVNPDILIDLETNDLPFKNNCIDVILMIDFIEHLGKNRGEEILKQAIKICKKKIILLTPLWWSDNINLVNDPTLWCYGNEYDKHKSLWSVDDFNKLGKWGRVMNASDLDNYFLGILFK